MKVLTGHWSEWAPLKGASAVTIGVLDGVHRGHRALIARLDSGLNRTVLTFDPHPLEVLRPGSHPRLITTIEERTARLGEVGVDQVGVLDLARIKDLPPEAFVEEILVGLLKVGRLVVGEDFRFGRDRAGDVSLLQELGARHGFDVVVIELVANGGGVISSSRIRALIESGDVASAAEALGDRYRISAVVIEGDKRGREIGYPTANVAPPERKVIPADGIYAALCRVDGDTHQAAVNIGVRPTFGEGERLIEAHILDFAGDLYGDEITIEFVDYVRPELRFDTVEALVAEMGRDVGTIREILSSVM